MKRFSVIFALFFSLTTVNIAHAKDAELICRAAKSYATYKFVKAATEVEADGAIMRCYSTTDGKGRPIQLCPKRAKAGDILDYASMQSTSNGKIVCQHGGLCFKRVDVAYVNCQR